MQDSKGKVHLALRDDDDGFMRGSSFRVTPTVTQAAPHAPLAQMTSPQPLPRSHGLVDASPPPPPAVAPPHSGPRMNPFDELLSDVAMVPSSAPSVLPSVPPPPSELHDMLSDLSDASGDEGPQTL